MSLHFNISVKLVISIFIDYCDWLKTQATDVNNILLPFWLWCLVSHIRIVHLIYLSLLVIRGIWKTYSNMEKADENPKNVTRKVIIDVILLVLGKKQKIRYYTIYVNTWILLVIHSAKHDQHPVTSGGRRSAMSDTWAVREPHVFLSSANRSRVASWVKAGPVLDAVKHCTVYIRTLVHMSKKLRPYRCFFLVCYRNPTGVHIKI